MKLEFHVTRFLCYPLVFKINEKQGSIKDFGVHKFDKEDKYSCTNTKFIGSTDEQNIRTQCEHYNITKDEYLKIIQLLEKKLSFGKCNMCY